MRGLFILLVLTFFTVNLNAAARIKFETVEIDFGKIDSGQTVDLEFKFSSVGDQNLVIRNTTSSCGCLAARLTKKEYGPGENGVLPVKFFSRGYNGRIVKSVTVSTNDSVNVYTRLKISGMVSLKDFAAIKLANDRIDFGRVTLGGQYAETIKIKNTGTIELRIIEITHSSDVYLIFAVKTIKPDQEIAVKLVLRPMQTGRFTTFLKIRTNAYRQRVVIAKISADVKN